jgi:hypothetical protein
MVENEQNINTGVSNDKMENLLAQTVEAQRKAKRKAGGKPSQETLDYHLRNHCPYCGVEFPPHYIEEHVKRCSTNWKRRDEMAKKLRMGVLARSKTIIKTILENPKIILYFRLDRWPEVIKIIEEEKRKMEAQQAQESQGKPVTWEEYLQLAYQVDLQLSRLLNMLEEKMNKNRPSYIS